MTQKPIPRPLYPCKYCSDERTWPAEDLFWSELDQDWVCDFCWDDRGYTREDGTPLNEPMGISLADEIKCRYQNMAETNDDQ